MQIKGKTCMLFSVILAMCLLFSAAGCGKSSAPATPKAGSKQSGFVVGFVNGYIGNTWRSQFVDDFKQAADEYKKSGVLKEYMIANSNNDASQQLAQINQMIDSNVDAIIISPASPTSLGPVVTKAQAKGILITIVNDPAAYKDTYCIVGNNDEFWNIQLGWFFDKLNGKGNIVQISGLPGNPTDSDRLALTDKTLKNYPNVKLLATVPGKWTETEAQSAMATLLSKYPNIDGVLEQDVMADGVMRAYQNAGKKLPIMTGDYTFNFFKNWSKYPDMESIGVSYQPGISVDGLNFTIRLLQGQKIKQSLLVANPMDSALANTIKIDPPYVVTKQAGPNASYMKDLKYTKAISLEQALQLGQGKPDTNALDSWLTSDQVGDFFEK